MTSVGPATKRPPRRAILAACVAAVAVFLAAPVADAFANDVVVSASPNRAGPVALEGRELSEKQYIFVSPTTGVTEVRFFLNDPAMTATPIQVERGAPLDFAGTAADGTAKPFLTRKLPNGQHTITAAIVKGTTTTVLTRTFTIRNATVCSPLPCGDVLIDLPYPLDFSSDHGGVLDGNGVGTGFTIVDSTSHGAGYVPAKLAMDEPTGALHVTTSAGSMTGTTNDQDNALAVGIDAPSQVTVIRATLQNPPAGANKNEQAGIWFGNNEDNFIKLNVLSGATGTVVETILEVGGERKSKRATDPLILSSAVVSLTLRANPEDQTVVASYQVGTGPVKKLHTFSAPGEFFSFDAAGIDPVLGTRSFGGIFASHRTAAGPLVYTFDDFAVVEETPPPPPPTGFDFSRVAIPVPMPTSMAVGPDGALYVLEMFGTIHRITLGPEKQVVSDQEIETLGPRLALGLTIDPASTPGNVIVWVSHSSPTLDDGVPNSGVITRLSGTGLTSKQDVVTGLPRAKANHATNSMHFGPDGRLYIAQGGNTGAGAPNNTATEFGTMQEQPLSSAMLVADVKGAGFDGSCANQSDIFGPPPCDVQTFATGLRNTYDFVFHTNGQIYAPNNGLGVAGSFPTSPTPPCFGMASTTLWSAGGQNPGEQPDLLNRIVQGGYYGQPNPYRDECVFADGRYQNVSAPPNYQPPLWNLGDHRSANGAIEYMGDAFCGDLRNEVLISNYSVGDNITRTRLTPDGLGVTAHKDLVGGFKDPLPLAQGPDGTIYVGEMGTSTVTALRPIDVGCWDSAAPLPGAILDPGSGTVNDKLYVVGGKTATGGHQSNVFAYDTGSDSWSTLANLPGPAVENPAVVGAGGQLYSFGGSTAPFTGAVANAAVLDPGTGNWTALPPMPTARGGAIARAIGTKIYVAGGMSSAGASLSTVEVFDTVSRTWSIAPAMGERRDNPGAAVLDGRLYIFGGRTRNADGSTTNGMLNTTEMYNPATNTWVARASMPTGRRTMAVGTVGGKAQVVGGEATPTGGTFPQNEEYDPNTDTWRPLRDMRTPRHGSAAGTVGDRFHVVGGGIRAGASYSEVHEAFAFEG